MAAVFPNGIRRFKTHRDLLDDVKASDINAIQEEVTAIQEVLGTLVNQVRVIMQPPTPAPTPQNPTPSTPTPVVVTTPVPNVGGLIDVVNSGATRPYFVGTGSLNPFVLKQDASAPLTSLSTYLMNSTNGTIHIPQTGFYQFTAQMGLRVSPNQTTATSQSVGSSPNRMLPVTVHLGLRNGNNVLSRQTQSITTRTDANGAWPSSIDYTVSLSWSGNLTAGTSIDLFYRLDTDAFWTTTGALVFTASANYVRAVDPPNVVTPPTVVEPPRIPVTGGGRPHISAPVTGGGRPQPTTGLTAYHTIFGTIYS